MSTLLKRPRGLTGQAVMDYEAMHGRAKVSPKVWQKLRSLENWARINKDKCAEYRFQPFSGQGAEDVLLVLHKTAWGFDGQPQRYRDGEFIYCLRLGTGPSEPLAGRHHTAKVLATDGRLG